MGADDWALCVGISNYGTQRLEPLPGARRDALRFYHWVRSPGGGDVPRARCTLLLSPPPRADRRPSPLADDIERWFTDRLNEGLDREEQHKGFVVGRRLYVFIAGHGLAVGEGHEAALLSADARPPDNSEHFAARRWVDWFRGSGGFEEVLLFMDCCRTELLKVTCRHPSWAPRNAPAGEARHFYAFGALHGASSREVVIDDRPGGQFTNVLLRRLRDRALRPLTASGLEGFLYEDLPRELEPQIEMRRGPRGDFVVAPIAATAAALPPWRWDDRGTLLVHDDTDVAKLASAVTLAGGTAIPISRAGEVTGHVATLLVAAESLPAADLAALIAATTPDRIVVYSHGSPVPPSIAGVETVPAHESDSPALARVRVRAAVERTDTATLAITAERWARLRVWSAAGELLADQRERVRLEGIPRGRYRIQAAIGPYTVEDERELTGDLQLAMPPIVLATTAPLPDNPRWSDADRAQLVALDPAAALVIVRLDAPGGPVHAGAPPTPVGGYRATQFPATRTVVELAIAGRPIAMAVPTPRGFRTEMYVDGQDLAIRVVPGDTPVGAGRPGDVLREKLRLVLAHEGPQPLAATADELTGDPIAALLLAAHAAPRPGGEVSPRLGELLGLAARIFGDDDADVRVWDPAATLEQPPLLARGWGRADVAAGSIADGVAGRQITLGPWLAWDPGEAPWQEGWLRSVATAMWPAWDRPPEPPRDGHLPRIALVEKRRLTDVAGVLGMPAGSVTRRTHGHKAVPIERARASDVIAFVGASNDQLPAALAVAFVEREQRRWRDLAVWFLDDVALDLMRSDNRSGEILRRARDRAQEILLHLLPRIAERWCIHRYTRLAIDDVWCFASLWDWTERGKGFVHVSDYLPGQDVRTTRAEDITWGDEPAPPPRYAATVAAYAALPGTLVGRGPG